MKKSIKFLLIFSIIIVILVIGILIMLKENKNIEQDDIAQNDVTQNKTEEDIWVISLDNKEEKENTSPKEEPKQEEKPHIEGKDPATLTQEIYNLNMVIGTLNIPKTNLTIDVYSNSDTNKMEKMPGFLYTTGGLNKRGITLFVGHNRRNGKIFSNNKKLVEGDVFYFKDYEGTELEYTIYSKFITTSDDTSFLNGNFDKPTIALSCCTDASDENRIIILGREK